MKIEVYTTTTPEKLWAKIKKYITEEKIKTWVFVKDSNDINYLTHTAPGKQWHKKALLEESFLATPSRLIFTVTWFKNSVPDEYTKGLYVGRFTEELPEHFRADFSNLETFA